ncbi:hypothetical protein B9G54_01365 [Alloscardovia macacae]|uniref:ComEC/Rec2 family competence protein n=1 Tax=Alloscardovia macacae TaxID=1160091 RepID=UPI000A2DF39F|nr:ComEC/Rec2 family competence protein [Alloscardovia macacae]OTA27200.1 hypothetical protein B9G54_01365 [Alloscardovia macacae]
MFAFSKHDIRILLAALLAWTTAALTLSGLVSHAVLLTGVGLLSLMGVVLCMLPLSNPLLAPLQHISQLSMLYACVILSVLCSCVVQDAFSRADIQSELSTVHAQTVSARVTITSPLLASSLRGFTCSVEATAQELTVRGIAQGSRRTMRIFARSPTDCVLQRGATYNIRGSIQFSTYGRGAWVLHLDHAERIKPASMLDTFVEHLHTRFLDQTSRLDTQGAILVPGVTMGVMGHDVLNPSTAIISSSSSPSGSLENPGSDTTTQKGSDEVSPDGTNIVRKTSGKSSGASARKTVAREAKKIKEAFRVAGIMHVLAVSGGHFALAVSLVTWVMKRMRAPRVLRAAAMIAADILLYIIMYPSDSILRAFIMGFFSAGYVYFGRRADSVSALSWTILCLLFVDPSYALSVGFSLSCAAVLGIILWSGWITRGLEHFLPHRLAGACAVTLAAHVVTLPISLLISPSIPVYAVVANVLIAVPMDVATVCGLLGLVFSWCVPILGYACVWVSSQCTSLMVMLAYWVSSWPYAQVDMSPWQLGLGYMVILVSGGVVWRFWAWYADAHAYEREYREPVKERWVAWWKETLDMFR